MGDSNESVGWKTDFSKLLETYGCKFSGAESDARAEWASSLSAKGGNESLRRGEAVGSDTPGDSFQRSGSSMADFLIAIL
jgi:hypothetical protein